ncbi:N-acetylglucosaminyl-phosphatidylinositol de-N-acetylase [Cryptosporidium ubiquitum]|uniref:N-acetylglucosaminylphosphatidylinositol deacetylase n=1 Tax=Cryptosporidium ubiquitum TaxID=857276 RepID=A0A1J4MIV2_9CRYT|nr:N-acetylglucosaminyl-phosphatidylinositol de-N-acetylase [Cryptosporidium ubiquitum]OII73943.1 N-acetylglucosaminyl-phosphatidylinositol de-N-acetylase [Cryptosporidium ubiquitum]
MKSFETFKNVCLVIAHPDDESMFFTPVIKQVCGEGTKVHLLCLTNGDYYGFGKLREKELFEACNALGILGDRIRVISSEQFQDQPNEKWPCNDVISEIESFVDEFDIDTIITFDEFGISGHINHISTNESIKEWIKGSRRDKYPKVYVLETSNLFVKYSGILSLLYLYIFPKNGW